VKEKREVKKTTIPQAPRTTTVYIRFFSHCGINHVVELMKSTKMSKSHFLF
jgi:hypothetical protein